MITTDLKYELVQYTRGVGLEISEAMEVPLFDHWISTSLVKGFKSLDLFADRSLDFIVGIGNTRDYPRHKLPEAMRKWWKKLKIGGSLVFINDVREIAEQEILAGMKGVGSWDLAVRSSHFDDEDQLLSMVFVKTEMPGQTFSCDKPIPDNAVVVIRYGAIGDCFVASSFLEGLKEQGHYVIFNTQQKGRDILKGNPHIDEFLMQDKDQMPNEEITEYWSFLKNKYGRIINLSETMEGAICAVPWRPDFTWAPQVRQQFRSANYYDFAHAMADVPLPPKPAFYPTKKEARWAGKQRDKIGRDKFILMWVLSGSAVHKRCPQTDFVLGYPGNPGLLQQHENLHIIFVGDMTCKILEQAWVGHPQVTCTSGDWSIRETLTMLDEVDCVVGPETGVVNVAGMKGVPTVIFLSHTSEDTVARYWDDRIALEPEGCDCFPCYKLHKYNDSCNLIETEEYGEVAACVAGVTVEAVQGALNHYINIANAERLAEAL
jgi:ADP-heptose:LPS heptosyltransferase